MNLALTVIAKDEVNEIDRIIHDYRQYFDEVVFIIDDEKVFNDCSEAYKIDKGIRFFKYQWRNDFSHKRNFAAEKTESPYYFRIDTDDEIENPERIRSVFNTMVEQNFDICLAKYIYSRDKDGNCQAEHWRETILRKTPDIYWNKEIHENILFADDVEVNSFHTESFSIIHNLTEEHAQASNKRNLVYLLAEYKRDKEKTDPRTIAYLGRICMTLGEYENAIPFLELLIKLSGWDDDKYFAWVHIAECHKKLGNLNLAIGACNEALEMNMKFPDAYITKGTIYLIKGDYEKALDWLMYGLARKKPDTMFVVNPSIYTVKVRLYIAMAYLGQGMNRDALHWFNEAKKIAPHDPEVTEKESVFKEAYETGNYIENLIGLIKYTKDEEKISKLLESIPSNILKEERGWKIKNLYGKPNIWSRKSVVIYCGNSWEDWTPASVLSGIGGSEEAVIYLSKELVKLGWEVTVFNQCGENAGIYEGVIYRNFWEFNPNDIFHILIGWRRDIFKNDNIKCRKALVWLHDILQKGDFKKAKYYLDKVIVLSQFHKSLLPKELPNRCSFVSSNGININDFKPSLLPRNPHRMIYTSSYDRGIEHLLFMWKDIKKEIPDAELHLFYGWKTYDEMMKTGKRSPKYRKLMSDLMLQEGVFEHGRVGHKQLIREFQKSGVWVYPSHFEEISCISAMKAQACGCVPVCTNYAALDETVLGGIKVSGKCGEEETDNKFKTELIKVLKDTKYQEKLRSELPDKDVFSWARVAKKWSDELFKFENIQYESLEDYEDSYAHFKKEVGLPIQQGGTFPRQLWASKFVEEHPELKTGIDIGSFDGGLGVMLSDKFKGRFVCDIQDIKDKEMDYARGLVKSLGLKTEFFTGKSVERFETDKRYDIVFLMEVLEHTLDPRVVINKIHSLLVDKGYLLITVPDKYGEFGRERDQLFNSSHLRDYTIETLTNEVNELFEVVESKIDSGVINMVLRKK